MKQFPQYLIVLYRAVRAAVGAGIGYAVVIQPDWSQPETTYKAIGLAFVSGFSVSLGKFLRNWLDEVFGFDEKSIVAKSMPI